ncbi:MAG: YjdF family protein [Atopobiaceae bacterium]|jgi:hypothetical protein|nr:YjdF family protein [Atopobiaceae bacterium]MCI2172599.1 YjdF family protein [Atopobiaceae bacterium]MCI2206906.1 YjdF family protein [Atopobiaceae bacterium]
MSMCKLTICFEDPFWVGLVETEDDGTYNVARHVFGAEPTQPEVEEFVAQHWNDLRFTADLMVEKRGGHKINPKRMRRIIEREVAANARRGTKAQQAIAEDREANKAERAAESKAQCEAREKAAYEQRRAKAKARHRGH